MMQWELYFSAAKGFQLTAELRSMLGLQFLTNIVGGVREGSVSVFRPDLFYQMDPYVYKVYTVHYVQELKRLLGEQ